jgi:hypothetical protein
LVSVHPSLGRATGCGVSALRLARNVCEAALAAGSVAGIAYHATDNSIVLAPPIPATLVCSAFGWRNVEWGAPGIHIEQWQLRHRNQRPLFIGVSEVEVYADPEPNGDRIDDRMRATKLHDYDRVGHIVICPALRRLPHRVP